jgi:hypothetical protein
MLTSVCIAGYLLIGLLIFLVTARFIDMKDNPYRGIFGVASLLFWPAILFLVIFCCIIDGMGWLGDKVSKR